MPVAGHGGTVRVVTAIMGMVIGLTFTFGFGNVLGLALRLGVPVWVAPLVAPAVDLSIVGLLLGTRHLALYGATAEQLRPGRRLLVFASVVSLALNVAEPVVAGDYGKAVFDAVGPLLLMGWSEVGPGLLRAISALDAPSAAVVEGDAVRRGGGTSGAYGGGAGRSREGTDALSRGAPVSSPMVVGVSENAEGGDPVPMMPPVLIERARQHDARHRAEYQRPISAETLRKELRVGAQRARALVAIVRADSRGQLSRIPADCVTG